MLIQSQVTPRMVWVDYLHATVLSVLIWSCINSLVTASGNESDRIALMAIKDQIREVPDTALASWNNSFHYCEWPGVTCSPRHPHRVTVLNLESQKLEGTLSPHLGNLSFLKAIILSMNNFHGPIPQEIGRLHRLQQLYLDYNLFDGDIPTNLTHCINLREINLIANKISGGVPVELTSLSKLRVLYIGANELKGSIPPFLGNLSFLTHLSLTESSLSGSIPKELCRIQNLKFFQVSSNNLTGMVPFCLYNLSRITTFSVTDNQLEGRLPLDIGLTLPNLQEFFVGMNKFSGVVPLSLQNASKLEYVELGSNQFTGQVPIDLGRLQGLRKLHLQSNRLGTSLGDDLKFITSLTNCSFLQELAISDNSVKGSMPNSIANLSTQIQVLALGRNQIHGGIPVGIENLVNLNNLDFQFNYLTGNIPTVMGMFTKMQKLFLHGNQFSGEIPDSFNNLTQLSVLILKGNMLDGRIPPSLGNCQNLLGLDLSDNRLNGTIPKEVVGLASLKIVLELSNNALTGSLPSEVGNLSSIQALDVSRNTLSGHIPTTLGKCLTLQYLNMKGNLFDGKIPLSLQALKGIKFLDLSRNKFSGEIPEYLGNFTLLARLNLSYNELEGPVPKNGIFANTSVTSIFGNSKLCGGVVELELLPCVAQATKKRRQSIVVKIIIPVVVSLSLILLLCFFLVFYCKRASKKNATDLSFLKHQYMRVSYAELLKATNSFSANNLIGVGSYGSVYKGVLDNVNMVVAVKVLNLKTRGASKCFLSECNALRNLRHRNLLKIITSCSSVDFQGNDFKALVFEFMPNGSLEDCLHPNRDEDHEPRKLNFLQRLNIASDVGSALEYLHHHCQPAIIHCDLKPSNVLLDDDMTAHVADFGLAKIFDGISSNSAESSSLAIKGSIGYVAPEYGMGSEVSLQGDVYSYGILLLELFTKKRPTDYQFQNGLNLHSFVKLNLSKNLENVVDPMLFLQQSGEAINIENDTGVRARMHECLVSVIQLGVACSAESPMKRMNMGDVVSELHRIRGFHEGVGNH